MKAKQPYVRFFPSDWLSGTRGLTAIETGVYITLICMMYENTEPVQGDDKRLARVCGCTPAAFRRAVDALIDEGKIDAKDGGYWNERVQKEFDFRLENSNSAKEAANKRWGKTQQKQRGKDASAMQPQCDRNAISEARSQNNTLSNERVSARAKKGTRLPANWKPEPLPEGFAQKHGITHVLCERELDKFQNYWTALTGQKATKLDWDATWRNWLCRAAESAPRYPPQQQQSPTHLQNVTDAFKKIEKQHEQSASSEDTPAHIRELLVAKRIGAGR